MKLQVESGLIETVWFSCMYLRENAKSRYGYIGFSSSGLPKYEFLLRGSRCVLNVGKRLKPVKKSWVRVDSFV